jgi:hypothetical protein
VVVVIVSEDPGTGTVLVDPNVPDRPRSSGLGDDLPCAPDASCTLGRCVAEGENVTLFSELAVLPDLDRLPEPNLEKILDAVDPDFSCLYGACVPSEARRELDPEDSIPPD